MTNVSLSTSAEPELGYGQLLQILWRRSPWWMGSVAASLGIAAAVSVLRSPVYQSEMQLLVEPNVSKAISINSPEDSAQNSSAEIALDYVTQLNLMRSKQFVEDVVATYPDVCEPESTAQDCVADFQDSLTLFQIEENNTRTRIFEAIFVSDDSFKAQKSLNALKQIYLQYNEQQQQRRLDEGLMLVNQQIAQVQRDLSDSQQALQQFRQAGETINPETQSLEAATALDQLAQTRQAVRADYQEAQAKYQAIQASLAINPEQAVIAAKLSQSGRYQTLLDALQTSELALAERLAVYTEADPIAQDLRAQRDEQVDLLRQESQRLLGEAANTNESDLLADGQLSESSLALVQEMINTQISLSGLAAREQSLASTQQTLQQQLDAYPALIAQYDRLQPEVETQRASLEQLLQTRQELSNELAQGGFKWEVVESPDMGKKIAPKPVKNLVLGAVAGLFVGGMLAYGRESTDTVIRTVEDLKQPLKQAEALPMLGTLPSLSELPRPRFMPFKLMSSMGDRASPFSESAVLSLVQQEPFREAIDLIYKHLQLQGSLTSVMVTSAVAREGKTTLAVGLALSAARSQQRVLLIDADLRNPCLHQQFGLSDQQGLTRLLTAADPPMPVSVAIAGVQIDVLPAGPLVSDPVRLLNSHRMKELSSWFEQQYDLIVFDTSAVLGRVDALQIASLCSGVVMVNRVNHLTQAQLSQAIAILSRVNMLGLVANGFKTPLSETLPVGLMPVIGRLPSAISSGHNGAYNSSAHHNSAHHNGAAPRQSSSSTVD